MKNLAIVICRTTYFSRVFRLLSMVLLFVLLSACTPNVSPVQEEAFALPTVYTRTGKDFEATELSTLAIPSGTQESEITPDPPLTTSLTNGIIQQTSEKDGMEMVYVPAGSFTMGSNSSEADTDEIPEHEVYLDAFWIDKYEVTNSQYAQCMAAGACAAPIITKSYTRTSYYGNSEYDKYPVIYVSWYEAQAYCQWAGRQLPTEAQWEKAARGTDGRIYPWGNEDPTSNLLNFNGFVGDTTAVGSYPNGMSPYGAMDMAGNVYEWVNDWGSRSYYSVSPANNPTGPTSGTSKVTRGGCWYNLGSSLRTSSRYGNGPGFRLDHFGFRCAMDEEN